MLALDFASGFEDLSSYDNSPTVVGEPVMSEGGAPTTDYVKPEPVVEPIGEAYMTVDGSNYLTIPHTAELALGESNGDFTVSLALI